MTKVFSSSNDWKKIHISNALFNIGNYQYLSDKSDNKSLLAPENQTENTFDRVTKMFHELNKDIMWNGSILLAGWIKFMNLRYTY